MFDTLKCAVIIVAALGVAGCCGGGSDDPPPQQQVTTTSQQAMPPQQAAPPQPEVFPIVLHRRENIGTQYHQKTTVTRNETQVMKMPGVPVKTETKARRIEFVARAKVMVADQLGQATTTMYTIERFIATPQAPTPGPPQNVLPAGDVLTVVRGSPPQITTAQGAQLSKQQIRDIKAVVSTGAVKSVTDDQVFGTQTPQKIGASWPVNSVVAAQGLSDGEIQVQPQGVSGQTRLVSRQKVNNIDCLEVSAQIAMKNLQMSKLPPGSIVKQGEMQMGVNGFFPVDTNLPVVKGTQTSNGRFQIMLNIKGMMVEMELTMSETEEEERTVLQ